MLLRSQINRLLQSFERDFTTHNRIEVSRSALLHNVSLFGELSEQSVIPVLKGNAYGHGITQVATALRNATVPYVAVDGYFEALRVREVSKQPVLVMGAIRPENFARMKYDNFAFTVQDESSIRALGKVGKKVKVHLECNTGMNRYGVAAPEVTKLTKLILNHKNLEFEGVMTHLADSDGDNPTTVSEAVAQFDACVEAVRATGAKPTLIHAAQSAGSLKAASKYCTAIRLGIGLYGINPFPAAHALHKKLKNLKPAMRFISTITKIIPLEKGDKVSYNYIFTAPKKLLVGVLPVGYHEGVSRLLSNKGVVKAGQKVVHIVGRVCMNHTIISLDGVRVKVGDEVVVYSNDPKDRNSIDAIAAEHNIFSYTLLTSLSPDVRRKLVA